jgi:catechol 2,3-dioxygenase-like lactoylglutathione lyase family enzyme
MRSLVDACLCLTLVAAPAAAQGVSVPVVGFDNMHILTPEPAQTREWYIKHLGAVAAPTAGMAYLGKTLVVFLKNDRAQPSSGSTIDHLGISFADVDAKMKELEAGGGKVVEAANDQPGLFKAGFIQDPWGVKIEVLQDAEALGLHHLHLRVKDPEGTLKWFQQMMGGERAKLRGRLDGLRYGPMWLLVADSGGEATAPSADRAIQHIAWRVPNIDAARTTLIGRGLAVGDARPYQDVRFAILESPSGVRVEIIQRPEP